MARTPVPAPASAYYAAAWVLTAGGLLFVLVFHLVPGLVAGLLIHVILRRLTGRLTGGRLSHGAAKLVAAGCVGAVAVALVSVLVLGLIGLVRSQLAGLPALLQKMAEALDSTSLWLEARGAAGLIPDPIRDVAHLKAAVSAWLRAHGTELGRTGGELGRAVLHVAVGMAVGLLVFFRPRSDPEGPLALALGERLRRLAFAFEQIVFAQVKISAINTALTAVYLLLVLPLVGVRLPLAGTLIAVTFLTGLLPVVGNLLSNTVIVLLSLGTAAWVAVASLVFLVVIHKLEYVVNARIVGGEIRAAAWELLLALFAFEAAFGVPGVVLAPIVYADLKRELMDRRLV